MYDTDPKVAYDNVMKAYDIIFALAMVNLDSGAEHDQALIEQAVNQAKELYAKMTSEEIIHYGS